MQCESKKAFSTEMKDRWGGSWKELKKKGKNKTQTPYILLRLETLNMIVLPAKSQRRTRRYGKDEEGEQGLPLFVKMEKLDQTRRKHSR